MTMNRAKRPYAPVLVGFDGALTPASFVNTSPITATWKRRDRRKSVITFPDAADEAPEAGTEYYVRCIPIAAPELQTEKLLGTGTSGTFNIDYQGPNRLEVFARKDGIDSAAFAFATTALNGQKIATGALPSLAVVPPAGSAAAVVLAVGSLPVITVSMTGGVLAVGSLPVITVTAPGGSGSHYGSFGYVAGEGTSTAQTAWSSEHDATSYVNNSGGAVNVQYIDLLFVNTSLAAGSNIKLALYADNADKPGALLGTTDTKASLASGTNTFTLTSPVNVPNGTKVWVAVKNDGSVYQDNGSRPAADRFKYKGSMGGLEFTDPWGATANAFAVMAPATLRSANMGTDDTARIIVVAGQSNSRSYDTTGLDVPAPLQGSDSGIQIWNTSTGAFQTYVAGTNSDTYNSGASTPQKWGPEAGFAKSFRAAYPNTNLYIVKIGVDSTELAVDAGNDWNPTSSGELFDAMTAALTAAKAALSAAGKTPRVEAVLWMQGEHDALNSSYATEYGNSLTSFITGLRVAWGNAATKLILGRITPSTQWTHATTVRAFQSRVARDTADVQAIDTDGYTLAADSKHYVAASVKTMGEDMYSAYVGSYPLLPARFGTIVGDDRNSAIVLSNDNLTAEGTGTNSSALQLARSDFVLKGKSYWEVHVDAQIAASNLGVGKGVGTSSYWGSSSDSIGYNANGESRKNGVVVNTYPTYTAGDRIMVAFDSATGKVWFGKNGTWNGDPAAGTGQAATLTGTTGNSLHRMGVCCRRSGDKFTLKCKASEFSYAPPAGFSAI